MLDILNKLFKQVIITQIVAVEFNKTLPDWFKIENITDKKYLNILKASLDKGEASIIALALEQNNSLLIIDDYKGRKYAEQLGIKITGSLGVLIEAKLHGHIKSVKPILDKIKSTDFRMSEELIQRTLEKSNEI